MFKPPLSKFRKRKNQKFAEHPDTKKKTPLPSYLRKVRKRKQKSERKVESQIQKKMTKLSESSTTSFSCQKDTDS